MSIQFIDRNVSIKSDDSGEPVSFKVVNASNLQFNLYWIDRSGAEISYRDIATNAQQDVRQNTMTSHSWLLKSKDGSLAFKFFPTEKGTIKITNSGPEFVPVSVLPFEDLPRQELMFQPKHDEFFIGDWSNYWGHGIPDAAKAMGISGSFTPLVETEFNNHKILNMLGVPAAWAAGFTGKGIKVAVLDSGIIDHPEFTVDGRWNAQNNTPNVQTSDTATHGLKVASVIASKHDDGVQTRDMTGVSPGVELIDIQIANGGGSNNSVMTAGIRKAVEMGAKVIQISFINSETSVDPVVLEAVTHAFNSGSLVVWAGGNFSADSPTGPAITALKGVALSVGNFNMDTQLPFGTSNLAGPQKTNYVFAPSNGYYPDAGGKYTLHIDGGTSFSSPYISGIAALLFEKYPSASVTEIMNMIADSAWLPSLGRSAVFNSAGNVVLEFNQLKSSDVNGTAATDVLEMGTASAGFELLKSNSALSIKQGSSSFDITKVDRVEFTDKALAFDIQGHAGDAVELISALVGVGSTKDKNLVGQVIHMFDSSDSKDEVTQAALDYVLGTGWNTTTMATTVLKNVFNIDADLEIMGLLNAMKSYGGMSDTDLFWMAAESQENGDLIGLIGLATTGLEYTPVMG